MNKRSKQPFLSASSSSSSQGYAYTFITEDQVRYAGDIIKALELSGSLVPPELEQLWASFKDQQKAVRGRVSDTQNYGYYGRDERYFNSASSSFVSSCSSSSTQEGKTIKSSSGFSGKGFKFDETEHALANERKKLQKAALGLQDSDDEDGALDVSKLLTFTLSDFKTSTRVR